MSASIPRSATGRCCCSSTSAATMFFGSRRAMKSVAAAEAAALAAWRVTSLGDRVGAVVFGDGDVVEIGPQARDAGVVRVLWRGRPPERRPRRARPRGRPRRSSTRRSRRAARMATHDWLVCLISDARRRRRGDGAARHAASPPITTCSPCSSTIRSESQLPDLGRAVFASGDAADRGRCFLRAPCATASPRSMPTGAQARGAVARSARSRCCRSRPTATSPSSCAS